MDFFRFFISTAITLAVIFVFILITRELWCWYLKQNRIVELLTEIRDELKRKR